jgi:dTDP-4-dehydrorhamnose 3,5-epimerase
MSKEAPRTALEQARCAPQTVTADWMPVDSIPIHGVEIKEIRNVAIRSGILTECYRPEWFEDPFQAGHVVYMSLIARGISNWHCHRRQKDVIVPVAGQLRVASTTTAPIPPRISASNW